MDLMIRSGHVLRPPDRRRRPDARRPRLERLWGGPGHRAGEGGESK